MLLTEFEVGVTAALTEYEGDWQCRVWRDDYYDSITCIVENKHDGRRSGFSITREELYIARDSYDWLFCLVDDAMREVGAHRRHRNVWTVPTPEVAHALATQPRDVYNSTQRMPVGKTKPEVVWDAAANEYVIVAPSHIRVRDDRPVTPAAAIDRGSRKIHFDD